jgi:hypothetical protein
VLVLISPLLAMGSGYPWQLGQTHRWAELRSGMIPDTGFEWLGPERTGLRFTNVLAEPEGAANRVLYNGAGVAVGDYDADGLPDLFLCSLQGRNRLYRNLGEWRFEDVTREAGLDEHLPESRGAVFADINGDRHLDLLISVNGRGVACFLNKGDGTLADRTTEAGTASAAGSTTLALADVDGNGTLDLYVANYRPDDIRDRGRISVSLVNGRPVARGLESNRFVLVEGRLEENGQADHFYRNDGTGRFTRVSWTDGTFRWSDGKPLSELPLDWGLCATFRDVNGDLAPDLYVCNDYWTPDRFWINDGSGRFTAIEPFAWRKMSASSMGADFGDLNRDGFVDFLVVDMLSRYPEMRKRQKLAQAPARAGVGVDEDCPQVMRNTLFLNRGDTTFSEMAFYGGLAASDWSWSPVFMDADLDGFEDVLIAAGHFRDVQDLDAQRLVQSRQHSWDGFPSEAGRQKAYTRELMEHYRLYPHLNLPIAAFRNRGLLQFEEVTEAWGLSRAGVYQGLAFADFDLDGALDLAVNALNGPAGLLRNKTGAGRVAVKLRGRAPNTQGTGAHVTLHGGAVERQTAEVVCGGRYLSGSDPMLVFATGSRSSGMSLEVRWRSGRITRLEGVQGNRVYEIDEERAERDPAPPAPPDRPHFEDLSAGLAVMHHEIGFNDHERQPLLPYKRSQLGPGIAFYDLDGDRHDDLIAGSGRGGLPVFLRGDGKGGFSRQTLEASLQASDDTSGVMGWEDRSGMRRVLFASTGYEAMGPGLAIGWRTGDEGFHMDLPGAAVLTNGTALAFADMHGDGQLSLLVAGGVQAGNYPHGAPSRVYRLEAQGWQLDRRNNLLLENLGIVNGAVWSDLNGDGIQELLLACEWGLIRVFQSQRGVLHDATARFGLAEHAGWWRGINTGDFNGDGRMDIVASNWGLNSPYRASPERPLVFAFGQVAQPGMMEVVETEYSGTNLVPRQGWLALAQTMPFLLERFTSHKAYSEATLEEVLGDRLPLSRRVAATTLSSMIFLNTGSGFEAVPLPPEAQLAPAFAVCVADFDGDGNEDVFLSQNLFGTHPEIGRIDAGCGLWLRGNGKGGFETVPAARSGIRVPGEGRGAAVSDFDEDGRVDLAVAQNGGPLHLYRNQAGRPGLRVRLRGGDGNPAAIGAQIRLRSGERMGPTREVHAGSGYWSQDSAIQVMAVPKQPDAVWVRWPGGRVTTTPVPEGAREITISSSGEVPR